MVATADPVSGGVVVVVVVFILGAGRSSFLFSLRSILFCSYSGKPVFAMVIALRARPIGFFSFSLILPPPAGFCPQIFLPGFWAEDSDSIYIRHPFPYYSNRKQHGGDLSDGRSNGSSFMDMGSQNGLQAFCMKSKDEDQEWDGASFVDTSPTRSWTARQAARRGTGAKESVD